jgi:choline kinase
MIECVVVLAAGGNCRMGIQTGPKALLPLQPDDPDSPSFLTRNLQLYRTHGVQRIYLVVSDNNRADFAHLADDDVELVSVEPAAHPTGSSVSMAAGLRALLRDNPRGMRTLITDADVVYERALLDSVAELSESALVAIDRVSGDGEEVRVYGRSTREPVLIGKGLNGAMTAELVLLGESLGLIVLEAPDVLLAADVVHWIVGRPPASPPYGYSARLSEHEEVWQYLFTLQRLPIAVVAGTLLFSECDFPEDLDAIRKHLYPSILERDELTAASS